MATATEDTARTTDGEVYGQVVDVSRLGGRGPAPDAGTDASEAVLIPWGFDEECQPIRWSGSWAWATPGTTGFHRGQLRPRAAWVDNLPTLDVYGAAWEGFPASPWDHPMANGMPKLTADQLYDLYSRLPTREEVVDRPYGAVSDLVEWRREAGIVAERYPAPAILEAAFEVAEVVRVRQSPVQFAGTYRIAVEVDGETAGSFWLRTGESGTAPWMATQVAGPREASASPAPSGAVDGPAAIALRVETLDRGNSACKRNTALTGSESLSDIGDEQGWHAELDVSFVASCFPNDELLGNLVGIPSAPDSEDIPARFSGAFVREDDGRLTFHQSAALSDGTAVEMRGERIDVRALAAVDPLEGWADERVLNQEAAASATGQLN